MTDKPILVYWDSCVFISCIQHDAARFGILGAIVEEAKSEKVILVASTMVIAETVKLSGDAQLWKQECDKIRAFFDNEFIEIVDVTKEIGESAANICREHGLKPPDAIHVATALKYGCKCMHAYDGQLLALNGKVGVPPLRIEVPAEMAPKPRTLFDQGSSPPSEGDVPKEARALPTSWLDGRARREIHPLRMHFWLVPSSRKFMPRSIPAFRSY